ncbi:hypothetical protein OG543_25995 [Streptomyces sp. NBC_01178]|uniref:hypothetical protein n=1 Tax=Streptomyces sp. NBC_01178 TaxID=2903762 RepID=UPI003868C575|nr:hypothetical protein OG543_25995 [Streptomyces sp. NBC_01178]
MRIPPAPPLSSRASGTSPHPGPDGVRRTGPGPARRRRPGALRRRWARTRRRARTLAALEWASCPPRDGADEHRLLLVHHRKVVGEVSYRLCTRCPAGQWTTTRLATPLPERPVARRVLSHLRFRHPDRTWLPPTSPPRAGRGRRARSFGRPALCSDHADARPSFPGEGPAAPADGLLAARR